MKASEHLELSKRYHAQSCEALRRARAHEHACDAREDMREFDRLFRLERKHYGIWQAVQTRAENRWRREHGIY